MNTFSFNHKCIGLEGDSSKKERPEKPVQSLLSKLRLRELELKRAKLKRFCKESSN